MFTDFLRTYPKSAYMAEAKRLLQKSKNELIAMRLKQNQYERFEVSSGSDAVSEWDLFEEKNGDKHDAKGLGVNWEMQVNSYLFGDPVCSINFDSDYDKKAVLLAGYNYYVKIGRFPKLEIGEIVKISGVFQGMAVGSRAMIDVNRIIKKQ